LPMWSATAQLDSAMSLTMMLRAKGMRFRVYHATTLEGSPCRLLLPTHPIGPWVAMVGRCARNSRGLA
jgi:hypothetical protein